MSSQWLDSNTNSYQSSCIERRMSVVMAIDEQYAAPLFVTVASLLENLGPGVRLELYLMASGLTQETRGATLRATAFGGGLGAEPSLLRRAVEFLAAPHRRRIPLLPALAALVHLFELPGMFRALRGGRRGRRSTADRFTGARRQASVLRGVSA